MRLHGPRTAAIVFPTALMLIGSSTSLAQAPDRGAVATTPHFAFYSDFATNLNDAVIAAGAARGAKKVELFQSSSEKACFDGLLAAERAAWNRVVDYYAEIVSPAQHSAPVQTLPRLELAGVVKKEALTDAADRRFLDITSGLRAAAAPAYERCRWSAQDAANRRWVDGVLPLLEMYGPTLAQRLPELYGTPWAGMPFRVDVVETVSYAGADSINLRNPGLHILVSSSSSATQGRAALEAVFHEASHFLTGFNTPLRAALGAAVRDAGGGTVRGDLTHPVHFFMTGEAVRRVLDKPGEPPYTPYLYALTMFSPEFRAAIKETWPAYLDGKRTLQEAAADLIRALGK
jgi:hypothetical protein